VRYLKRLSVFCSVIVMFVYIGIITNSGKILAYNVPNFSMPFSAGNSVQFSSGPHAPSTTFTQATVSSAIASGIDFSGQPFSDCDGDGYTGECGWTVLAMGSGKITFMGLSNSSLGNVIVQEISGSDVSLVYAHLYGFSPSAMNDYMWDDGYVSVGTPLGYVGGTGSGGAKVWTTHLHVDLRTNEPCTQYCLSGTDVLGFQKPQLVGNPLSWYGRYIDGYSIYPYCTSSDCSTIYNYDGVAVRSYWGAGPPSPRNDFRYKDTDAEGNNEPISRIPAVVWGLSAVDCTNSSNCEDLNLVPAAYRDDIIFSGKGSFGNGGYVESSNTEATDGGDSPPPVIGDDPVDFREDPNYGGGQYGNSANPRTIINFDGWANDIMSSVQIDSGYSTMVFTHSNGQGGKRCLVTSIPDLQYVTLDDGSNANNALSSFIWYDNANCDDQYSPYVASGDSVTVYAGFNWEGTQYGGSGTNQFNLPDYIEGAVSSIGVLPGNSAIVYQLDSQQGGARCFSASDSDLRDNYYDNGQVVDDNMHSLKLFTDINCGGWTPAVPTATYTPTPTETPTNTPVPAPQVTLLVLVNADTELDIAAMYEGMVIDVAALGTNNFSIRAEATGEESVVFGLDGNPSYSTESTEPYALNGDNGPSDYYAWTPSVGSHFVSVTAFSQDGGTGTQSTPLSYNFIVYDSTPTATPVPVNLVYNPSFEIVSGSFPDNWSTGSGLVTLDQSSNGNDGVNSIHFAPTNDYITLVSGGFSVTAAQTYTFNFFAKSGNGTGSFGLRADFSDENWSYVTSDNIGTLGADVNGVATYTYTIPAGVAHMSLQFYSNAGTQFDVYVDSVVVQ